MSSSIYGKWDGAKQTQVATPPAEKEIPTENGTKETTPKTEANQK